MPETPEYIMKKIRGRMGLEPSDGTSDGEIKNLNPMEKLREAVAWELGHREWADTILMWAKDCGVDLDEVY
jgi:hypothetical protein